MSKRFIKKEWAHTRLLTKLNNSTFRGRGAIEIFNFVFLRDYCNYNGENGPDIYRLNRAGCFNIIQLWLGDIN